MKKCTTRVNNCSGEKGKRKGLSSLGIIFFSFSFFSRAIVYSCGAFFQKNFSYVYTLWATFWQCFGNSAELSDYYLQVCSHWSLFVVVGGYLLGGFVEAGVSLFFFCQTTFQISFYFPLKNIFTETFLGNLTAYQFFCFLIYCSFRYRYKFTSSFSKICSAMGIYDYAFKLL